MKTYQWTAITQHGTLIRFYSIEIISAENIVVAEAEIEKKQYLLDNITSYLEGSEILIGTILIRQHN